jgi:hypothetical protein
LSDALNIVVDVPRTAALHEIHLELAGNVRESVWDDVFDEGIKCFAGVLSHGGFGPAADGAAAGQFEVKARTAAGRSYSIRAEGAQPGACRVLVNMCLARSTWSGALSRIAITGAAATKSAARITAADRLVDLPYPSFTDRVPFACEIVPSVVTAAAIAVRLRLSRQPQPEEMAQLSQLCANWVEVADGGYPDDDMEPADCVVDATELYERDRQTLEMRIRMFEASYESWQAVIGMLARRDPAGRLVRELLVEP